MTATASIGALPHALRDEGELTRRFAGRRPTIFLDYDGTLTPTCVFAARAGRELEFYFGRRLLLVDVCHHLTQGTVLPTAAQLLSIRINPRNLSGWSLWRRSEATPVFELPNDVPSAAMARRDRSADQMEPAKGARPQGIIRYRRTRIDVSHLGG